MKSSAPLPVSDARASSVGSEKTLRKPPRHSRSAVAVLQQETAAQHPRVPGPALASRGGLASSPGKQATAFPLPPLKHTNRAKSVTTTVSKRSFITQPAGNCRESDARASRPTLPGRVSTGVAGGKLHAAPSAFQASSGRAASVSFATMCERSVPDVQSLLGSLSDETDWSPDPGASLSWASSNSTSAASSVILSSSEGSLLPTQDDLPRKRHGAVPRSRRRAGSRMQRAGSETNTKRPGLPRGSERPTLFDVPLPKPERLPLDLTPYLAEGGEKPAERTAPTQTDAFHLLPGDAPFVPAKRGVDAATQLFGDEELFHFAEEVSPLVDVLVWKTLDEVQSELGHEAELEAMVAYRTACVERCRARLEQEAQAERLERLRAENTRMLIEFNERKIEQEVLVVRKLLAVEAAELTPFYPLVACCLDGLRAQGAFIEDATVAVQTRTMVQLHQNIETALAQLVVRLLAAGTSQKNRAAYHRDGE
uniref:Uncharacterized protein n=1 Tax=Neospora caninum (strain Liverpool) TaxID=572307 RepID=A0A0F7UBN5_NEOCL|nr:TPA: hypothetical protein BN1204_016545 [Neospora caninum Liverpool]